MAGVSTTAEVMRLEAAGIGRLAAQGDGARRRLAAARGRRPHAAGRTRSRPWCSPPAPTSARAIGRVEAWYARRGLPRLLPAHRPAGAGAARRSAGARAAMRGCRRSRCSRAIRPGSKRPTAAADRARDPADAAGDERGLRSATGARQRRARAELFARIRRPHVFARAARRPAAGRRAACASSTASLPGSSPCAPPCAARGRGHGRAVLRRLGAWARRHGAPSSSISRSRTTTCRR